MTMAKDECDVLVVGCGIGGMAAAVAALQQGARVTILERAPREERGGQTRYTEAYLRMKSQTEVTDDFETHLVENTAGYIDPSLVHAFAESADNQPGIVRALGMADPDFISAFADNAGPTLAWIKEFGVRFDFLPTQFLTKSQPRLLPVGGGEALIEGLGAAAEKLGATFLYETAAHDLAIDDKGEIVGIQAVTANHQRMTLFARNVVLACGGFEGSSEMTTRYLGPRSVFLRPVCRGAYYNRGEGIRMALAYGAAGCGDFGSYHAEPIDPRSGISEPSIFIYPYGILVNQEGRRFTDEAPGTVDAYYERVTREIYQQSKGIAYAIVDARHMDIPNYRLGIRTDQPPITADTIPELAKRLGIDARTLQHTIETYNAACRPGTYTPLELDGLATEGLTPPKSNWSLPLDRAPYHAYPIISANVFTFGGLKTDASGRVVNSEGDAIPGLYAAGEIVGLYSGNYTGATSVLKGAVFGRLAGMHAANRHSR
jgi:tricarballylate dehydrogenase